MKILTKKYLDKVIGGNSRSPGLPEPQTRSAPLNTQTDSHINDI